MDNKPMPEPQAEESEDQGQGEPGEGSAADAIQDIQSGFQTLQKMMQAAQGSVSPDDMKLFQAAVQATDAFVQSITSGGQQQSAQPQPRQPQSGPMDPNANAGAKPAGY